MDFATIDLTARIGTEVRTDIETLTSGRIAKALRALLNERGVLLFRGLNVTDEQQLQFARTMGEVRLEHGLTNTTISADRSQSPIFADYTQGTYYFHIDGTYTDTPGLASILCPRVLAPRGGQTQFCNTYALYDDLPDAEKAFFEGLRAVHSAEHNLRIPFPDPTPEQLAHWGEGVNPPKEHPLVWQHENGRKSLLLATTIKNFVGMDRAQSDGLVQRLLAMAEDPQYSYSHDWQLGDMLIWDNTGTMHRVVPFDLDCGRRLNRVVLLGEEQVQGVREAA